MTDPTTTILTYFEDINAFPRCSRNEKGVCQWLQQWAAQLNLSYTCDNSGNMVARVPPSPGYEDAPTVVLQGHMDMVCEKTPESTHDFTKDPIVSHREGDWLTAGDTTLGADNGIAIAYMMALVEDASISHPPLELLFTVDEETGLNGAKQLGADFIKGRMLINLDSEDEGIFTIGCAGGIDTNLTLNLESQPLPSAGGCYHIIVGGLKGGHSGIDIHKHRGNANKLLARTLARISKRADVRLVSFNGGSLKNAIPRDAEAVIWAEATGGADWQETVSRMEQIFKEEFAVSDNALFLRIAPMPETPPAGEALSQKSTEQAIQMLLGLPNGVYHMSPEIDGVVETSCNLAIVSIKEGGLTILSSQRGASVSRLDEITNAVHAVANLAGAAAGDQDVYPPWQPRVDSILLSRSKVAYQKLYSREPVIQVIHAGLECAVIGDIYPGMDMISFGPTIRNPHSPDERIWVPSIEKVWAFLVALLKSLKD